MSAPHDDHDSKPKLDVNPSHTNDGKAPQVHATSSSSTNIVTGASEQEVPTPATTATGADQTAAPEIDWDAIYAAPPWADALEPPSRGDPDYDEYHWVMPNPLMLVENMWTFKVAEIGEPVLGIDNIETRRPDVNTSARNETGPLGKTEEAKEAKKKGE